MSRNQRKHPRVRAKGVGAHLRTEKGRSQAMVENISAGGIFVRTDRLEAVGTEIFVDLVKPGWKRALTLNARVTSRVDAIDGRLSKRMPGMGIQFLRVDDKQFERLRELLRVLGAPDPGEGVTLPDEEVEDDLKELMTGSSYGDPLDPQPQPVWQQVQLVEEAIAGALREADLPAPGPVVLDEPLAPPAKPQPVPFPLKPSLPPQQPEPDRAISDAEKLMMQIKGLVMQLSDAQQQIAQRDAEIDRLKEEIETLRGALERAVRRS